MSIELEQVSGQEMADYLAVHGQINVVLDVLNRVYNADPKAAHAIEDKLKTAVLMLASVGHPSAGEFARELLRADVVGRWEKKRLCA